jgi:hypothetical protein
MPWPLYPQEEALVPIEYEGSQSWSGCFGEEKNLPQSEIETLIVQPID